MKEYGVILGGLIKSGKVVYTQLPRPVIINNILKAIQRIYDFEFDYEVFQQCCFQIITAPDIVKNLAEAIKKEFEDRDFSVYIEYGTGEIEHLDERPGLSYGPVLTQVGRSFDKNYKLLPH